MIFGGNKHNCGTWMDKMGESEKASNKGVPATPRDGAAIEITGLLKSCLRWLSELWDNGIFKFEGVTIQRNHCNFVSSHSLGHDGSTKLVKWKEWNDKIQKSFEPCYYIPSGMPPLFWLLTLR